MTGAELKAARERMGLSVTELARRLGMSKGGISRYEGGERDVPHVVFLAVSALEHAFSVAGLIVAPPAKAVPRRKK